MRAAPIVGFDPSHPSEATQVSAFCESHVTATDPPIGASGGRIDILTETGGPQYNGVDEPVGAVEVPDVLDAVMLRLVEEAVNGATCGKSDCTVCAIPEKPSSGIEFRSARVRGPTVPTLGSP